MSDDSTDIIRILRVLCRPSARGAFESLLEALSQPEYEDRQDPIGAEELTLVFESRPELLEEWFCFSEDKRTSDGWYLLRSGEVGRVGHPESEMQFDSLDRAAAEYVMRELAFWGGLEWARSQLDAEEGHRPPPSDQ